VLVAGPPHAAALPRATPAPTLDMTVRVVAVSLSWTIFVHIVWSTDK